MGKPLARPRRIDGKIGFMPSDGVFIGARDLVNHVPLRVRIVEVLEYPAGTMIGGRASTVAFPAIAYEAKAPSGKWVKAKRPLRLNATNHMTLFVRFGGDASWWSGMEITLDLTPQRNPTGGRPVAGIIVVPELDESTEEQVSEKLRRALRGECPYERPPTERQPGEDDEPLEDVDTTEPPDDARVPAGGGS